MGTKITMGGKNKRWSARNSHAAICWLCKHEVRCTIASGALKLANHNPDTGDIEYREKHICFGVRSPTESTLVENFVAM